MAGEKELRVTAYDAAGNSVFQKLVAGTGDWLKPWPELGEAAEIKIPLGRPGVYRVAIWSPKRQFRMSYAPTLPVTLEGWVNSQGRPTPRLYFYVPKDVDRVAIYTSYTAAGPPRFFDPTGAEVQPAFLDEGKLTLLEVPAEHRGALVAGQGQVPERAATDAQRAGVFCV